jgi:tRNA pseudouridine38-40 synthase
MGKAAAELIGQHDFAAYCKPRPGATTIRTLYSLDVGRDDDGVIVIEAHADAFCHNQVRAMVGALIAVGEGRRSIAFVGELLRGRARDNTLGVAPASGLTFTAVDYPPDDELAARAAMTRQRRRS